MLASVLVGCTTVRVYASVYGHAGVERPPTPRGRQGEPTPVRLRYPPPVTMTRAQDARPADRECVWRAIRTRRVVRRFAERPLERRHLDRILDAGRKASSAKNLQRWDFIVCVNRAHLGGLAAVGPWAGHLRGAAAGIALVTPDPHQPGTPLSVMFDLGQAAAAMMLAAWELGVGSVPATVYEQDLARRLLGYPKTHHCEYLLSFGYPADAAELVAPPRAGGRRPRSEVVHDEHWGRRTEPAA